MAGVDVIVALDESSGENFSDSDEEDDGDAESLCRTVTDGVLVEDKEADCDTVSEPENEPDNVGDRDSDAINDADVSAKCTEVPDTTGVDGAISGVNDDRGEYKGECDADGETMNVLDGVDDCTVSC